MRNIIIPRPTSYIEKEGYFDITAPFSLACESLFESELMEFCKRCSRTLSPSISADRKLTISYLDADSIDEGYSLSVTETAISVEAAGKRGAFYGLMSLEQLYLAAKDGKIACCEIHDSPRYEYRGFMLDVARHFFHKEVVLKLIDLLAYHKLNKLHLHLVDDQGWRIQIDAYPKLTEIGSMRSNTLGDKTPHGGFFTKEDLREIVTYAESKFITVIPEFDLPGHFTAAIASYPELGCTGAQIPVATTFGIKRDIACSGKQTTYDFIYAVLREIADIFPSEYIHIGGDEAFKLHWRDCPDCAKVMQENNVKDVFELQGFMTNKVIDELDKMGKRAIVWNESINSGNLTDSAVCHYWQDGNPPTRVVREINRGRRTIVSSFSPMYLDYPHAMHSLRALYEYNPELDGVSEANKSNIWGVECPLWTEYVHTEEEIGERVFPRLTALCEKGWSKDCEYDDFVRRLPEFAIAYSLFGISSTKLKDANPKGFAKIKQMIPLARRMLRPAGLKSLRDSMNANREVAKLRNEIEKKHQQEGDKK